MLPMIATSYQIAGMSFADGGSLKSPVLCCLVHSVLTPGQPQCLMDGLQLRRVVVVGGGEAGSHIVAPGNPTSQGSGLMLEGKVSLTLDRLITTTSPVA